MTALALSRPTRACIVALAAQQKLLLQLVDTLADDDYRRQFHPDLSPAGWHLGHAVFVEDLWLREHVLGEPLPQTRHRDYLPEKTLRSERSAKLPPKDDFVATCATRQRDNIRLLHTFPRKLANHPLLRDDYLIKFMTQHHAMHNETLCMTLTARRLHRHDSRCHRHRVREVLRPRAPRNCDLLYTQGADRQFGSDDASSFDNERPRHTKHLPAFYIRRHAVTNAEYLGFMRCDGYENSSYWSRDGWRWLQTFRRTAPEIAPHHWRRDRRGRWFGISPTATYDLPACAPVHGINFYEATAFANYANARLPNEFEWEAAARHLVRGGGWEWCANPFQPYPNFRPFPYARYSNTWFDDRHYTLKGHSAYSPAPLHRRTIRNFYTAEKRHIFAGIRLAARLAA